MKNLFFFHFLFLPFLSFATEDRIKIYIECTTCDETFFKQDFTYPVYVRDRLLADVHIQIVKQNTGSGGEEHTFFFYGQNEFAGINDTLVMHVFPNSTDVEIRKKQLKHIQIGLIQYIIKKGNIEDVAFDFVEPEITDSTESDKKEEDPWKRWVFSIYTYGNGSSEDLYKSLYTYGTLSANKITEDLKIETSLGFNYNHREFKVNEEWIKSETRSQWGDLSVVKAINPHWSGGLFTSVYSSIYSNYKLNTSIQPGIEYNIFPYDQSSKRQVRFTYKTGGIFNRYNERTIYDKTEELLFSQSLSIAAKIQEKWGSVETAVSGTHYFHDFDLNSFNFWSNLSLRLFKGFSWDIYANFQLIHNQISLSAGGLSSEDILLQQRQLQTGHRFYFSTGISYTFGSIYNNVVNPRFGN